LSLGDLGGELLVGALRQFRIGLDRDDPIPGLQ
jgi:hypothetical protein